MRLAGLCKGSTADSDSVCEGSNPSPAAKQEQFARPGGLFLFIRESRRDSNPHIITIGALGARRRRGFESFSRCHDKCRICLPGKSGIFHVYGAKIPVFLVISTKNRSCWTVLVWQELFFCLFRLKKPDTFWCKTALHNTRLK